MLTKRSTKFDEVGCAIFEDVANVEKQWANIWPSRAFEDEATAHVFF